TTPIIDVDTHLAEAPDLWTSRLPAKWHEDAPHIRVSEQGTEDWWAAGRKLHSAGQMAMAGWGDYYPTFPPTHADMDPGAFDAKVRLERMDEYGIYAAVLFPNILGFATHAFLKLAREGKTDIANACVRAYNDHLAEFVSTDPNRLIALMCLPYWDV